MFALIRLTVRGLVPLAAPDDVVRAEGILNLEVLDHGLHDTELTDVLGVLEIDVSVRKAQTGLFDAAEFFNGNGSDGEVTGR